MLRVGIDVGGTNTDAVVMDGATVLSTTKAATTQDVNAGIRTALAESIGLAGVAPRDIRHVMIGTTHFTNAIVERRRLARVAAIRLGLPAAACLPPLVDWPTDLKRAVGEHTYMVRGGYEYDGRVLSELDFEGLAKIAQDIRDRQIGIAAISSIFGPVNDAMEKQARAFLTDRCPGLRVVLSSEVGRIGLLERESAAILNAALLDLAAMTVDAFRSALRDSGLSCGFSISQNDGTLMPADRVRRFPVMTFASGPTNSLRGATLLAGLEEALVVDIGGTTSDIGVISKGFPRQASSIVEIGGVRTNFSMPDISAIGLGGGSTISPVDSSVGPRSVGHAIASQALVFGGSVLTATDIAVRMGAAPVGDPERVAHLPFKQAESVLATIHQRLQAAVERRRPSAARIPVIAVGGGAFLMPARLGNLDVVQPKHAAVANAIGAAIAQVSGAVDRIVSLEAMTRRQALEAAKAEAKNRAVAAGALADSIRFIEVDDQPLAYLPGKATRLRVKAVGDLGIEQ